MFIYTATKNLTDGTWYNEHPETQPLFREPRKYGFRISDVDFTTKEITFTILAVDPNAILGYAFFRRVPYKDGGRGYIASPDCKKWTLIPEQYNEDYDEMYYHIRTRDNDDTCYISDYRSMCGAIAKTSRMYNEL